MKTINKILATLLILVMVLSLVPMTFAAEADYTVVSGDTVEIGIDIGTNYGFETHWNEFTYSNSNIITSVSGDDSDMHITGEINANEGAFYFTGTRPTVSSVFVVKLGVSGNVGETCEVTIPYLVCEDGTNATSYTMTVTIEIVAAHTHSYTWKHDANQHWKECSCGDKIEQGSHTWEWVIDTPAGEFSSGSKHEECKTCGRTRNEGTLIDPTHEHNYGADYKHDANQHWKECACGDKIAIENHTWSWVVDTPAGEHTSGVQHEECSVCHRTRNEGTPIAPTHECVFGGWRYDEDKHWKECSCGDHAEEGAHTFGEWTVTKYPSATEPGAKVRECSVCGYKDTAKIDPTGSEDPDPSTGPSTEPTVPGTEPTTPTTPGTEPTVPGTEPESTPAATEPSAPTQPIKPGTQDEEDGCCWWWLLILLLILIGVVLWYFLIFKNRKKKDGKKA